MFEKTTNTQITTIAASTVKSYLTGQVRLLFMHVSQYTSDELLVLVYIQECTALFLMCAQCDQMCLLCCRIGFKVQEISDCWYALQWVSGYGVLLLRQG